MNITEEDVAAYCDGMLDPTRAAAVRRAIQDDDDLAQIHFFYHHARTDGIEREIDLPFIKKKSAFERALARFADWRFAPYVLGVTLTGFAVTVAAIFFAGNRVNQLSKRISFDEVVLPEQWQYAGMPRSTTVEDQILSPVRTAIVERRPTIRWSSVKSSDCTFVVTIEQEDDVIWTSTEVSANEVTIDKALEPGSYEIEVEIRSSNVQQAGFLPQGGQGDAIFEVLTDEQRNRLIRELTASPSVEEEIRVLIEYRMFENLESKLEALADDESGAFDKSDIREMHKKLREIRSLPVD